MSTLRTFTLCGALIALTAPALAIGPVEQQFNACLHKSSGDCPTIGDIVAERQAAIAPVITPEEVEIVIPEVASCTARPWFQRDAQWECSAPVTPWNGGVIRGPSADNDDPEAEEEATLDVDNGDQKGEDTTETVIEEDEVEEVEEVQEEEVTKERKYRDHKKRSRRHEARKNKK